MLTEDGFLQDCETWTIAFAESRANELGVNWHPEQIKIVNAVRMFWQQSAISPANRALLKLARVALNSPQLSSIDLIDLLSDKPALDCARIAGIPRPKNCF